MDGLLNIIGIFNLYKNSIHIFRTLVNDLATFFRRLCDKKTSLIYLYYRFFNDIVRHSASTQPNSEGCFFMGERMKVDLPKGYTDTAWSVQVNYDYYRHINQANGKKEKDPNSTMDIVAWSKTFDDLIEELKKDGKLKDAIWILHDKDTSGKHIHFALLYSKKVTHKSVIDDFSINNKEAAEQNVQPIDNWADYIKYLLHETDDAKKDGKHQYEYDELKTTLTDKDAHDKFIEKYKNMDKRRNTPYNKKLDDIKIKTHARKKKLKAVDVEGAVEELGVDVLAGNLTPATAQRRLIDKFGLIESAQYSSIFNDANKLYLNEKTKDMVDRLGFRNLYIAGVGDSGKTTTATALVKKYIDDFGLHRVAAGSKDFAGNYFGQRATIYNESDPKIMNKEQLKDVFDPFSPPVVSARYFDKPWFPDICVHANSLELGDFLSKALWHSGKEYRLSSADLQDFMNVQVLNNNHETKNEMSQFVRRFPDYVYIDPTARIDKATGKVLGGTVYYYKMRFIKHIPLDTWSTPYELIQNAYREVATIDYTVHRDHKKLKEELEQVAEKIRTVFEEYSEYTLPESLDNDSTGELYGESWKPAHSGTDMVEVFWDELESDFKWDLLPTTFLYDLFKEYSKKNNPSGAILSKPAFTDRLSFVIDDTVWENHMGRNKTQVKTGKLMDDNEPLILDYNLYDWMNPNGRNDSARLNFFRKEKYRGLKRL